jgi:hypothetical protein
MIRPLPPFDDILPGHSLRDRERVKFSQDKKPGLRFTPLPASAGFASVTMYPRQLRSASASPTTIRRSFKLVHTRPFAESDIDSWLIR